MCERKWLGLPPLPVRILPKKRIVEPITTPEMLEAEVAKQKTAKNGGRRKKGKTRQDVWEKADDIRYVYNGKS